MIPDRAQRVAWLAATAGVVALALAVSLDKPWVSPRPPREAGAEDAAAGASPEAGTPAAEAPSASDAAAPPDDAGALSLPSSPMDLLNAADASTRFVRMGVVLVQFSGAQGAAPNARPKAAALELARRLADEAKADFHQAVTHGDPGSADDIGRIARGILEGPVEGLVFSMAPGQTSEPVETPRGYWVVKRLQ